MNTNTADSAAVVAGPLAAHAVTHTELITCRLEDPLGSLARTLVAQKIHAIVLAATPAEPLIITDLELIRAALSDRRSIQARDLRAEPIPAIAADATLDDLVAMMAGRGVDHVVLTNPRTGEPCGIVSSFDVAALIGGQRRGHKRSLLARSSTRPSGAGSLQTTRAGDAMHPGVVTCGPGTSIRLVARCMAEHQIHCVAIAGVSGGRHDRHYRWGLVNAIEITRAFHRNALADPVGSIASTAPAAVTREESLAAVASLMIEDGTAHVVVIDESGLPCGMISTLDVLAAVA
jgi:CBS domain-containing protein